MNITVIGWKRALLRRSVFRVAASIFRIGAVRAVLERLLKMINMGVRNVGSSQVRPGVSRAAWG